MEFQRIAIDHRIMGGVPCIKGTRIPVTTVVAMVAEGTTIAEVLNEFTQLSGEDVREALRYAAAAVDEHELPSRTAPATVFAGIPLHTTGQAHVSEA